MADALTIGDYLLDHGLAALTGPDAVTRRALQWLAARGEDTVTLRELLRGPLGGHGTSEQALGLAENLVQYGAARPILTEHSGPGRPPSPAYEINPAVMRHADKTDRTHNGNGADDSQDVAELIAAIEAATNDGERDNYRRVLAKVAPEHPEARQ